MSRSRTLSTDGGRNKMPSHWVYPNRRSMIFGRPCEVLTESSARSTLLPDDFNL